MAWSTCENALNRRRSVGLRMNALAAVLQSLQHKTRPPVAATAVGDRQGARKQLRKQNDFQKLSELSEQGRRLERTWPCSPPESAISPLSGLPGPR